jgi:heterogeneous nuclear ribonucleoprotein F/H
MVNDETAVETPPQDKGKNLPPNHKDDPYADSMILQCRGFPFSIEKEEVLEFLGIDETKIEEFQSVVGTNGKPSGECFIVVDGEETRETCMEKHKKNYAETGRYVDIFKSSEIYYNRRVTINTQFEREWDGIVRLRGLPFAGECKEMIEKFFRGCSIIENGIHPICNKSGKSTGEAYVEFASFSAATKALGKNKKSIGDRYIEVFQSSNNELRSALLAQSKLTYHAKWADKNLKGTGGRQVGQKHSMGGEANGSASAPDGPDTKVPKTDGDTEVKEETPAKKTSPYPYIVQLQVVPEGSTAAEIQKFFKPHRAIAVNVKAGGEVDVAFKTHDMAVAAMAKEGNQFKGTDIGMILDSEP